MPLKLVHAADLHLDSPLRGLARYEGAPVESMRAATRRALANLVDLCAAERADALLVAGDLFDGDWRDFSTGLFFAAQMSRLREAGVRVFLVRGNHDAASRITKGVRLPDNVTELATGAPQTIVDERLGLAVHGQGFATREVTEDLAAGYPTALPGLLNVGLLHTSLNGRPGHEPYAPTSIEILSSKGYDYWALGHVHAREIVSTDPPIVFPGNLQGRHARETGPKGATLVTFDDDGAAHLEHRSLDVVRWSVVAVDASECRDADDVVEAAARALRNAVDEADGRLLAARIEVRGRSAAHRHLLDDPDRFENDVRAASLELGAETVWVEKVRVATGAPLDRDALCQRDDPVGRLARSFAALGTDDDALLELAGELGDLMRKLPAEVAEGEDGLSLGDLDQLRALVAEAEELVLPRLFDAEEP